MIPVFPGLHPWFLLYFPLQLDLIKFWLSDRRSQMGQLSSVVKKCVPFGCFYKNCGFVYVPNCSTIFALRYALHPPLPPQCGRPLNTTANQFSSCYGLCPALHHLSSCNAMKAISVVSPNVVCLLPNSPWLLEKSLRAILFMLWFAYVFRDPPFVWGALLILCLAIDHLPTSVSALRNSSKSSLQLGRFSTKYANSILYFLALIIIIIEYLYNYWFDARFSHSLVNSLRAGIMPAWLTILSLVPLITSICQLNVEWMGWTEAVAYAVCVCTYVWR